MSASNLGSSALPLWLCVLQCSIDNMFVSLMISTEEAPHIKSISAPNQGHYQTARLPRWMGKNNYNLCDIYLFVGFRVCTDIHRNATYRLCHSCSRHSGHYTDGCILSVNEMCIQPLIRKSPRGKEFD